MDEITALDFHHQVRLVNQHIDCLFIAFKKSLLLANEFHTVVVMDCTYKTNKYKMPMLHFLGIDGFKKSFTMALCFMGKENEDHYSWALNALKASLNGKVPDVCITDKDMALMNVSSIT